MLDRTVRAALPPHTPQGRRAQRLRTMPERDTRVLRARQQPGHGCNFGTAIKEGVPGLQRGPKTKPLRPADSIILSECHPPVVDSADGQLRPVQVPLFILVYCMNLDLLKSPLIYYVDEVQISHFQY